MKWKSDWSKTRRNLVNWWNRKGLVLHLTGPAETPREGFVAPSRPGDLRTCWLDPKFRCDMAEHEMAGTFYLGDAFPYFDTQIGPGSLCTFLGSTPNFAPHTVWYDPCIGDPDACTKIEFRPQNNFWLDAHLAVIDEGLRRADGRYLVGIPDLIENLDTLASLRGTENVLEDLLVRPEWVMDRLADINEAFFAAFDILFDRVRDADGGNSFSAFHIWGPGKTAKLQCDISVMISPAMFRRFVQPHLRTQCDWLDYSLYHLDGEDAIVHLDSLLEIESLDAVEWTPVDAWMENPYDVTKWYDLFRRIKAAGKSVQAIRLTAEQVIPLLDAVGPEGMFIETRPIDQKSAEKVLRDAEPYLT